MSERWLLTGARGFLGGHAHAALVERGVEVIPLDHHPPAQPGGLIADLATAVPDLGPRPPDVVVHLASLVHHQASGEAFERTIVGGTRNLLAAIDRFERAPRAFVYASSVAVYGPVRGEALAETTPATATSPYGRSKREAEEIVAEWSAHRGTRSTLLRLPALVGAGMVGSLAELVAALRRRTYVAIGPGSARRSLVLAEDVAAALPELSRQQGVFHLTDRRHPTFREIEVAVRAHLGRRPPLRIPLLVARLIARAADLARRAGFEARFSSEALRRATTSLTFDDARAATCFGWSPRPVLDEVDRWMPRPAEPAT